MDRQPGDSIPAAALFSAAVIGVAALLVPLRSELGQANTALILVLVVIAAAATGGRFAGAVVGVAASVSFNFFHTKPYLTVRIDDARDMLTVALILIVGLAVGELGVARARQSQARRANVRAMRSLEAVGALVSAGRPSDEVWPAVQEALVATLGVHTARFDAATHHSLPTVARDGTLDVRQHRLVGEGFVLPAEGATIDVVADGEFLGQIVLMPDDTVGVTREQRRAAVALADQFAIALKAGDRRHRDER